jgi:hypothetical protein
MSTVFRELENRPHAVFDETDLKRIYAEDWAQVVGAINALEDLSVAIPDVQATQWVGSDSYTRRIRIGKDHVGNTYAQIWSDSVVKIWANSVYIAYLNSSGLSYNDNYGMTLGSGGNTKANAIYGVVSSQVVGSDYIQCAFLGVPNVDYAANYKTGRYWILAETADRTFNFAHGVQTNPTLFIHSANQSTTEWLSFCHDQTDAIITNGKGNIKLSAFGYVVLGSTKSTTGDPTAVEGLVYINTYDNKVRMYADGAWRDLSTW